MFAFKLIAHKWHRHSEGRAHRPLWQPSLRLSAARLVALWAFVGSPFGSFFWQPFLAALVAAPFGSPFVSPFGADELRSLFGSLMIVHIIIVYSTIFDCTCPYPGWMHSGNGRRKFVCAWVQRVVRKVLLLVSIA